MLQFSVPYSQVESWITLTLLVCSAFTWCIFQGSTSLLRFFMRHGTIILCQRSPTERHFNFTHSILSYPIGNPLFADKGDVDSNSYVIDYDADTDIDEDDSETISIPEMSLPLSDASLSVLSVSLDPLQQSDSYGADIYLQAVNLVYQLMISDGLANE